MDTLVNVIILSVTLIALVSLIIGATIKINTLMNGNKIDFLENKKLIFGGLITHLRDLHQSNLEDAEEQELRKAD